MTYPSAPIGPAPSCAWSRQRGRAAGCDDGDRAARMPGAIGADRAMNRAPWTMAVCASHHEHIPSPRGDPGQHGTRIAFGRLDDHVKIARDPTGRAECPLGEIRGNLALLRSFEGQDHVTAAVAGTAMAAVPPQAESPHANGHQLRPTRPGKPHRPAQRRQPGRRVVHSHNDPSAFVSAGMPLSAGRRQRGHHRSPSATLLSFHDARWRWLGVRGYGALPAGRSANMR